ncbi:hypothetical protein [Tatumella ptyseos]|uniref:hypothetical protein n=1 Tax=Tatumella ptyseos TaxID=82987 RepID=UPI0023EFCBB5|nr:hypothetical protein [Tatumella ptyseos]
MSLFIISLSVVMIQSVLSFTPAVPERQPTQGSAGRCFSNYSQRHLKNIPGFLQGIDGGYHDLHFINAAVPRPEQEAAGVKGMGSLSAGWLSGSHNIPVDPRH